MPRHAYIEKNIKPHKLALINLVDSIAEDYMAQGYVLTIRQAYYQLVARDLVENTMKSYKRVVDAINDGRLCGYIDWDAIEDRTRNLTEWHHDETPRSAMQAAYDRYAIDRWENQPRRVEVWVEKEALAGVLEQACGQWDVPFFACRGYVSQSEQWRAGERIADRRLEEKQRTVIIHLGDHDPSGIDMTRDNQERLDMFAGLGRDNAIVERIALNWDRIEEYDPPANPAKTTDSRFAAYQREFGTDSWELDALEPATLVDLVTTTIQEYIDPEAWSESAEQYRNDKAKLAELIAGMEEDDD